MPKSWCEDAARRAEASVPEDVIFSTKQRLARKMLSLAFESGFSPDWVLADEVYGSDSKFRLFLEERGQPYAALRRPSRRPAWTNTKCGLGTDGIASKHRFFSAELDSDKNLVLADIHIRQFHSAYFFPLCQRRHFPLDITCGGEGKREGAFQIIVSPKRPSVPHMRRRLSH